MRLKRKARKWYQLEIETTPPIDSWDASFDRGETWVTGASATVEVEQDGTTVEVDVWRWLVAGDLAPTDDGQVVSATLTASVRPQVRGTDDPEIEIEDAPRIVLVS